MLGLIRRRSASIVVPLWSWKYRLHCGSQHVEQNSKLLKLVSQLVFSVAAWASIDHVARLLKRKIEQEYCSTNMMSDVERVS